MSFLFGLAGHDAGCRQSLASRCHGIAAQQTLERHPYSGERVRPRCRQRSDLESRLLHLNWSLRSRTLDLLGQPKLDRFHQLIRFLDQLQF